MSISGMQIYGIYAIASVSIAMALVSTEVEHGRYLLGIFYRVLPYQSIGHLVQFPERLATGFVMLMRKRKRSPKHRS